jgi:cation/acetate symporter
VQIIKAILLMTATIVLSLFVLGKVGFNPVELFNRAADESEAGKAFLAPGQLYTQPIDTLSPGLALVLGTAGLPHILMRFFTVPDAKAARGSVMWAVVLIGAFYVMTTSWASAPARCSAGAPRRPWARAATSPPRCWPRTSAAAPEPWAATCSLAIIAAVAFATILVVVAGLVISASGAVAHDVWSNIVRRGRDSEHEEVHVARIAAFAIGAIAIAIAVIGGEGLNVSFMVGLAFAVAASANFPALLLALTWRRFNTAGAVTGVVFGVVSSILLIVVSPKVWPGPDSEGSPIGWTLANPGIVSIPLGFIGCWLGTVLTREHGAERTFAEQHVRSETGIGAERAVAGI